MHGPFPWKDFRRVYLIKPIKLYQCGKCGEHQLAYREGALLDKAIEASIRMQVRKFIQQITLREHCSQVGLAERLGVTPEYLSALKHGTRTPGFQTFNFLKTLALEAKAFDAADPEHSSLKKVSGW